MSVLEEWKTDVQPRHPWYKERLHRKFLKETNHKLNLSGALNSHRWKFLPQGVEDFRDGYPSTLDSSNALASRRHFPVLQNVSDNSKPVPNPKKKLTKEQVCYSRLLPLQQSRREYIAEIEYGLTQHPLALYPHLEDGIQPELFEDIVEILDPEMRLKSPSGFYEDIPEDREEEIVPPSREQQDIQSVKSRETSTRQSAMSEQSRLRNPYTWISKQEEPVKEEKMSKITKPLTPALDESVKQVTKDFCDWVTSLGGETCNVNESTIFSLFASGYDTKPALSVPIHVVELNNVPAELRMSVGASAQHSIRKASTTRIREPLQESTCNPGWGKTRYGAWYLDPKTWKKLKTNEPLSDPATESNEKGNHLKSSLCQKTISSQRDASVFRGSNAQHPVCKPGYYAVADLLEQRGSSEFRMKNCYSFMELQPLKILSRRKATESQSFSAKYSLSRMSSLQKVLFQQNPGLHLGTAPAQHPPTKTV